MPVVPSYDNLRTSIGGSPSPRVGGPAPGEIAGQQMQQTGDALSRAGGEFSKLLLDAQREANDLRVTDALNQAVQARTAAHLGVMKLRGRDALERPDGKSLDAEASGALQQQFDTLREGLGNDAQKQAFGQRSANLMAQFRASVGEHVLREYQAHADEVDAATIATAQQQWALLWNDEKMRAQSRDAILGAVGKMAQRKGWDRAQVDEALVKAFSPAHAGVLKSMMDANRATDAKAYYDANSAEMTMQARATMQGAIAEADRVQRTQQALDGMAARGLDTKAMLAEARANFTGTERDDLERRIEHRATVEATTQAKAVNEVSDRAWTEAQQTGRVKPDTVARMRELNAGHRLAEIENFLDARMRRAKADAEGKFTTDIPTYLALSEMSRDPATQAGFVALDLNRYRPFLSDNDIKHFDALKTAIGKGDARASESLRVVQRTVNSIKFEVMQAGIDLTPKEGDKTAIDRAQRFTFALTQALDQAQAAAHQQGKVLSPEEAKRIGLDMLRPGVEQGSSSLLDWLRPTRRGFEIVSDPDRKPGSSFIAARYDKIPEKVRTELLREIRPTPGVRDGYGNEVVTPDVRAEIERMYTRGVSAGRFQAR